MCVINIHVALRCLRSLVAAHSICTSPSWRSEGTDTTCLTGERHQHPWTCGLPWGETEGKRRTLLHFGQIPGGEMLDVDDSPRVFSAQGKKIFSCDWSVVFNPPMFPFDI